MRPAFSSLSLLEEVSLQPVVFQPNVPVSWTQPDTPENACLRYSISAAGIAKPPFAVAVDLTSWSRLRGSVVERPLVMSPIPIEHAIRIRFSDCTCQAIKMVEEACKKGTWVLLQNCHLYKVRMFLDRSACLSLMSNMLTFMPQLEKMCETLEESAPDCFSGGSNMIHKDFRLFLTSMSCTRECEFCLQLPAAYFPVAVLQNGIKLTTVTESGVTWLVSAELSVLDQERRKFGPLGWNIRYEFNDSDLETSTTITHNMLELDGPIPWDRLLFVIGHINYGGRVTDDNDRKCLLAILEKYVTPKILESGYTFSESGTYRCPDNSDTADIESWRKFVASFPLAEQPEVFGMHDNANISFMSQESEKVLNTVLSIQPREAGGGGGKSSEEIVVEISAEQESRLPERLHTENAHPDSFAMSEETGLMTSLGTCLTQEMAQLTMTLKQLQKDDEVFFVPKCFSEVQMPASRLSFQQPAPSNSDGLLANREFMRAVDAARERAAQQRAEAERLPGGVKKQGQVCLATINKDKMYEGKIVKAFKLGLLLDINADVLGLLRWKHVRGVPRKLLKEGGHLANLRVDQVGDARLTLRLECIGHEGQTFEEEDYPDVVARVYEWAMEPKMLQLAEEAAPTAVKRHPGRNGPRAVGDGEGMPVRPPPPFSASRFHRPGKCGPRQ
ncbi:DNAH6 [Symbiodinium sp. CCMP2592]|nr:DNAH6 [Symbiodinium sp. CCMP2592]